MKIENERANLESKKEIVKDKCELDRTCKENAHLEKESDHNKTENVASENDELKENLETDDDKREETVNGTEEEGLEIDDQDKDSSVISDQRIYPNAARKLEESEKEIEESEDENEVRRDLQNKIIGAKTLQVEFMNYEKLTLKAPVRKHGKPEIGIAGSAEIQKDDVK